METRRQTGVMAEDGSVPGDGIDSDIDDGIIEDDDIIEALGRCDPVDAEALPSSRSAKAMRTLEQILESDQEPEAESDESSPSPTAGDHGGREGPPPCPTSQ